MPEHKSPILAFQPKTDDRISPFQVHGVAQIPMMQSIREGGDTGKPAALNDGADARLFSDVAKEVALSLDALQTRPAPEIIFED